MAAETLAEEHQVGQEALVSLIPAVIRQAWPLLDPHNIKGTLPQFLAAVRAIVARYGSASAAAALDYYRRERAAAGVTAPAPSLRLAPSPADSVIEDAIGWATADLYGPVTDESVAAAQTKVDEAVSKMVLDQGRATVIDATNRDRAAKGWARVTEQGACSFCIMLALRAGAGFLYTSKRSADFPAHDNCRCHVEPVFTAYEPSHRMRELERVWQDSTKGRSGHDARVAFRQAVEGRPVTGAESTTKGRGRHKTRTGKGGPLTGPRSTPKVPAKRLHEMSRAQLEHQLALTEGLKDSEWRTGQLARLRKALRTAK